MPTAGLLPSSLAPSRSLVERDPGRPSGQRTPHHPLHPRLHQLRSWHVATRRSSSVHPKSVMLGGAGLPMPRTASSILPCRRLARHRPEPPKVSRHLVVCRGVPSVKAWQSAGCSPREIRQPQHSLSLSTTSTSLTTHNRATPTDQLSSSGRQRGTVATGPLTHGWAKPGQYLKINPVT